MRAAAVRGQLTERTVRQPFGAIARTGGRKPYAWPSSRGDSIARTDASRLSNLLRLCTRSMPPATDTDREPAPPGASKHPMDAT